MRKPKRKPKKPAPSKKAHLAKNIEVIEEYVDLISAAAVAVVERVVVFKEALKAVRSKLSVRKPPTKKRRAKK